MRGKNKLNAKKGANNMLTKENKNIQPVSALFKNPIPSSRYEVILKTGSDVINNPCNFVINQIIVEASSIVDEKVITILPVIHAFMQCKFEDYDLMDSDIINGSLILTYGVVDINSYESFSELISNEIHSIHASLTKLIEDNLLTDVKLTVDIASY